MNFSMQVRYLMCIWNAENRVGGTMHSVTLLFMILIWNIVL